MEREIASLRKRLLKARSGKKYGRYTASLRDEIVATAIAWQRAGRRRTELVAKLGIDKSTLEYWLLKAQRASKAVRPVKIVSESALQSITLRMGGGVTVEGLTVADVVALVRGVA